MMKLIVFDLDNTLAKIGKGIEPIDINLLKQIEAKGIMIAICSGKPVNYLCGFMRQVGLEHPILMGENGAVIQFGVDLPPKEFYKLPYSDNVKESITYIKSKIDAEINDMWYQPNEVGLTPFPKSDAEFERIAKILEENKERLNDVKVYRHVDSFDIVPTGIDKRKGLEYLCNLIKILPKEIVAVGDGVNDYPMFAFTGKAIGVNIKEADRVDINFSSITEGLKFLLTME